jgi:hypothetical protein
MPDSARLASSLPNNNASSYPTSCDRFTCQAYGPASVTSACNCPVRRADARAITHSTTSAERQLCVCLSDQALLRTLASIGTAADVRDWTGSAGGVRAWCRVAHGIASDDAFVDGALADVTRPFERVGRAGSAAA